MLGMLSSLASRREKRKEGNGPSIRSQATLR